VKSRSIGKYELTLAPDKTGAIESRLLPNTALGIAVIAKYLTTFQSGADRGK
jgi:hypothetical protein